MQRLRELFAAALMAVTCAGAQAQGYPNRPIRIIVGYTPGGAADTIARIVGDAMGRQLGQTVTVDNRPGAGSTLGSELLARAPNDGYTLGLASGTLYGIDQHLYKVKYTPADFTPITRCAMSPLILAVNKNLNVKSLPELLAFVKANPDQINYASSGIGGTPHLGALAFEKAVGAKMTHIPYKGGSPAIQAVAQGDVHFSFGTASSVLPLGQQGLVRMLGVSTLQRSAVAPELPTLAESGLAGFEFSFWFGLFGPAHLPKEVVEKLHAVAVKVLADPDVETRLLAGGNEAMASPSPAAFHEAATREGAAQRDRAVQAGVTLQ